MFSPVYVALRIRRTTVGDVLVSTAYSPDAGLQVAIVTDGGKTVKIVAEREHWQQVAILKYQEANR